MNRTLLLTVLSTILISHPLWAQSLSGSSGRYVIEQRYVQQLAWIGDDYTLKYEVVIEQNEGDGALGEYKAYMHEFTDKPNLQVSMPLGKYRYRVIPYDYLEQPGEASDWVNIEINPVPLVPVEVKTTEDGYALQHSENKPLIPGVNEIVIINPDELETEDGVLAVKKQPPPVPEKPFQFYLSAAWEPTIPLYGGMSDTFGNEFYAAGAAIRFGLFYNKLFTWLNPGLELSTSWYTLNKVQNKDTIGLTAGIIGLNVVAQKRLLDRILAVTLRVGGAIAFQTGEFSDEKYSYLLSGLSPLINLEASFLWFPLRQLYLEIGLNFTFLFNQDDNSGCMRPWLGVGWQF